MEHRLKILSLRLKSCVLLASAMLVFLPVLFCLSPVSAQEGSNQSITQGFKLEGNANDFIGGVLVSTKENSADVVLLSTKANSKRLVGVVSDQPLLELSSGDTKTRVATSGTVLVIVSDINGNIKAGDKITPSPVEGVGMRANGSDQVVGTAQDDFDIKGAPSRQISDSNGDKHTIHLGRVPLQVGIAFYQTPTSGFIPPFVQGLANSVAGRQVSFMRIIICSILLLLSIVSTAALLYGAVRSGLISLGRNPLAAKEIQKGLIQVGVSIVLILGLAVIASYIILTI